LADKDLYEEIFVAAPTAEYIVVVAAPTAEYIVVVADKPSAVEIAEPRLWVMIVVDTKIVDAVDWTVVVDTKIVDVVDWTAVVVVLSNWVYSFHT